MTMKKMVLLKLLQWPKHEIIQKYCKFFKSVQGHQEHDSDILLLCCNKNVNMIMLLLCKKIISKQATTYSKMNNYLTICPNSNSKYYSEIRISLI